MMGYTMYVHPNYRDLVLKLYGCIPDYVRFTEKIQDGSIKSEEPKTLRWTLPKREE